VLFASVGPLPTLAIAVPKTQRVSSLLYFLSLDSLRNVEQDLIAFPARYLWVIHKPNDTPHNRTMFKYPRTQSHSPGIGATCVSATAFLPEIEGRVESFKASVGA